MTGASAFHGIERLFVDAMNVIGSRPDGWWRDRDGAVRRLVSRLQTFAEGVDAEVVLVVDGRPVAGVPEGRRDRLTVRYASRRGRNAADDRIVELLTDHVGSPGHVTATADVPASTGAASAVVTADRELRERAAALGARSIGPHVLLAALDRGDRPAGVEPDG